MITKKSTIFFMLLITTIGGLLFFLKYSVIEIENRIKKTKSEIISAKRNQHILKAEWKTLTSPDRLQKLTYKYLKMRQMEPKDLQEFAYSIFHNEMKKPKKIKRLRELVKEITKHNIEK